MLEDTESILAIERFAAAQGIAFRREMLVRDPRLRRGAAITHELTRQRVRFLKEDAIMYPYTEAVCELVKSGETAQAVDRLRGGG